MTSIHETIGREGLSQSENTALDEKENHSSKLSFLYHDHSNNFQKQAEKAVVRRCDLAGTAYLEYVRLCKSLMDMTFDAQNKILTKMGLRSEYPQICEYMLERYCDAADDWYSNQINVTEDILYMAAQNMKLINANISGFSDVMLANYLWWIRPISARDAKK